MQVCCITVIVLVLLASASGPQLVQVCRIIVAALVFYGQCFLVVVVSFYVSGSGSAEAACLLLPYVVQVCCNIL